MAVDEKVSGDKDASKDEIKVTDAIVRERKVVVKMHNGWRWITSATRSISLSAPNHHGTMLAD